jgi:hypothetical protein
LDFRVEPPDVEAYARQLADGAAATRAAKAYIGRQGTMTWHDRGSLSLMLRPGHETFVDEMTSTLGYLSDLLDRCEEALKSVASWYEETDRRSASRLDATYPQVRRQYADPEG